MSENPITVDEAIKLVEKYGGFKPAARSSGVPETTLRRRLAKVRHPLPVVSGQVSNRRTYVEPLPEEGDVFRYILTSAQNNTKLHGQFWANLVAYAEHIGGVILVSRFVYDKYSQSSALEKPTRERQAESALWYAPELEDYIDDDRRELAPGLVWCGEVNILPTASHPLSGFESYTGRASGIFPHPKIAMQSIASGKHEATKFNYTTGAVTQRNYIQRKAGLKAEFHHSYGALLVEVDSQGRWFARQIVAAADGSFFDLTMQVIQGEVTDGHSVEAVNWGDAHAGRHDPEAVRLCWGEGGMLDTLKPKFQFFHDLLDFHSRNHHEAKDPHRRFERHIRGEETVEKEIVSATRLLQSALRPWVNTVVVDSNHDNALGRWLREGDWKTDPVNARFFLTANAQILFEIEAENREFHLVEWAFRRANKAMRDVIFLREDQSFVILAAKDGGIECGMHGHLGPNGARGNPKSFARMARAVNTGHEHSAGIIDGVYTAGTISKFDMGYNRGPSSWSHSQIVTYKNGKRAIITFWGGKWRA